MDNNINRLSWNLYSNEYNKMSKFDKEYLHVGLGIQGLDASLLIKNDMNVLDVGCGNGANTYIMSQHTNGNVVGIDLSTDSISMANSHYNLKNLKFYNCDFEEFVKENPEQTFDLISYFGSIDYIKLDEYFFDSLNNISKKGTLCVISKFHPFWSTLYDNDVDDEKMHSYFDDGRADYIVYGSEKKYEFIRFHYSISYMINTFHKYGWQLDELLEPKPDYAQSAFTYEGYDTDDTLTSRLSRIPMTLVMIITRRL